MPSRRRDTGPTPEQRAAVWERAGGCCERCGRGVEGQVASIHHRKPRRMGGTRDPEINSLSNLMLLCGSGTGGCHGMVEKARQESRDLGFLVGSVQNPSGVPVLVYGKGACYLESDGSYTPVVFRL